MIDFAKPGNYAHPEPLTFAGQFITLTLVDVELRFGRSVFGCCGNGRVVARAAGLAG